MADKSNTSTSGGIGVAGLLGVLFVALKLTHVIAWPWLWVLAPFWIPFAIFAAILVICGLLWVVGKTLS